MADLTYETISNPYNPELLRTDSTVATNDVPDVSQEEGGRTIKSGSTLTDAWIDTWIKSTNYEPKKRGFLLDGIKGYFEAVDAFFSGTVIALAGQFGSADNYWKIGANGITAVATTGDVMINYGKADFGQDGVNGFILGYDYSASVPKFEIGSSAIKIFKYDGTDLLMIGGTIKTNVTGARVEITGNDEYFYDASTGGGGTIVGNTASIYFLRTDGANGTFHIQKRKSTISNAGNVVEFFYDDIPAGGVRNYIFLGLKGDLGSNVSDFKSHVIGITARDLIQIYSSSIANHPGWGTPAGPEVEVIGSSWDVGQPNAGGSRLLLSGIETTVPAGWATGGSFVAIGVQQPAGFNVSLLVDDTAGWAGNDFLPLYSGSYDSGNSGNYWRNVYTEAVQIVKAGHATKYLTMNGGGGLEVNADFYVGGTLSKAAGTFKIDHPLKPDTHYLQHSFAESPDMLNLYRGKGEIINGECFIQMPDWFIPLNGTNKYDFDYQLTSIGQQNNLWVKEEMSKNGNVIFAGEKNGKFSYLISGIRHDKYAEENRIQVEKIK